MKNLAVIAVLVGVMFISAGECLCPCPYNYAPVCGSDGVTYANECGLECVQAEDSDLEMLYEGACKEENNCVCTADYTPVCGSDGETYSNQCALECEQNTDSDLEMDHRGPCRNNGVDH